MWKRALLRKHLGVFLFSLCRGKRVSTGLSELFKCKQLSRKAVLIGNSRLPALIFFDADLVMILLIFAARRGHDDHTNLRLPASKKQINRSLLSVAIRK